MIQESEIKEYEELNTKRLENQILELTDNQDFLRLMKPKAGEDYWKPNHKYQVVDWLYEHCKRKGIEAENFKRMKAKRVFAIYHAINEKAVIRNNLENYLKDKKINLDEEFIIKARNRVYNNLHKQ